MKQGTDDNKEQHERTEAYDERDVSKVDWNLSLSDYRHDLWEGVLSVSPEEIDIINLSLSVRDLSGDDDESRVHRRKKGNQTWEELTCQPSRRAVAEFCRAVLVQLAQDVERWPHPDDPSWLAGSVTLIVKDRQ